MARDVNIKISIKKAQYDYLNNICKKNIKDYIDYFLELGINAHSDNIIKENNKIVEKKDIEDTKLSTLDIINGFLTSVSEKHILFNVDEIKNLIEERRLLKQNLMMMI